MRRIVLAHAAFLLAALFLGSEAFDAFQFTVAPRVSRIDEHDYDMREFATQTLSDAEWAGGALFDQRCRMCHTTTAPASSGPVAGPVLNQGTLEARGEARVRDTILNGSGRMPGWRHTLTGEQVANVVTFLKGLNAAPTPPAAARANGAPATPRAGLVGTARTAERKPLEGVVVSAKADASTITTSVFTDSQGEYVFPPLPAGSYRVWAQAAGYDTGRALVILGERPVQQAFTLGVLEDYTQQLSGSDWMNALPERSRDERRLKAIVAANCVDCHSIGVALQNRFDARSWMPILQWMYPSRHAPGAYHRDEIAAYLEKVRGPKAPPLPIAPQPRPTGDAARVIVTEYDVPAYVRSRVRNDGSDWLSGYAVGGGPHDNTIDDHGMVWMTQGATSPATRQSTLTKLNPKTGQVTAVRVYGPDGKTLVGSHGIERDATGHLWFDAFDGSYQPANLGRIDPATGGVEIFTPPPNMSSGLSIGVDIDPKGRIWSPSSYGAVRFDPDSKGFDYYRGRTTATLSYGIAGDSEGNGWWTQYDIDQVAKVDVRTGKVSEVKIEPPGTKDLKALWTDADRAFYQSVGVLGWGGVKVSINAYDGISRVPGGQAPRRMGADHNGDSVWVPTYISNYLVKIDIRTLAPTYYALPVKGNPYTVRVDRQHGVWVALGGDDRVVKFEPATEKWTVYQLPGLGCNARHIAIDGARDEVWVPCNRASKVNRLQFRTAEQVQARKAELLQTIRASR